MAAFQIQQHVRFQHCDPAAMVFYPRYFEMINLTVEEWFRTGLDWGFQQMHEIDDRGIPTARIAVDFSAPSRLGDVLDWSLTVKRRVVRPRTPPDLPVNARPVCQKHRSANRVERADKKKNARF